MSDLDHGGMSAAAVSATFSDGRHAPDDPGPLAPSSNLDTVATETRHHRHDGWTPALRASFLDMLAKSGIVTDACREVQRSAQAAYALCNRDRLFAAGWDAALSMARARLVDELFHRSINGTVDQIWKNGEVVAERHHHDNRLSIAFLNRLDARFDRAERAGAATLRLVAEWDTWLAALAEDRLADAQALLDPPPAPPPPLAPIPATLGQGNDAMLVHQLHQLRAGQAIDETADPDDADAEDEDEPRVWIQNHSWRTSFPPPDDFNGDESGFYEDGEYDRSCTPEEATLLDARYPDACEDSRDDVLEADEAERDAFFAALAEDEEDEEEEEHASVSSPSAHPEPVEGIISPSAHPEALLSLVEGPVEGSGDAPPPSPDTS